MSWSGPELGLGLSMAALTLLSEDAALLGSAGLAASGRLGWGLAFAASAGGIIVGDLGLYGLGRWLSASALGRWPWLDRRLGPARLARGKAWIEGAGFPGVLAVRFIPGSRLPGYTAAGLTRARFGPFALAVVLSGALWAGLVLGCMALTGRACGVGWGLALLAAGLLGLHLALRGGRRAWRLRAARWRRWGHAEFWPAWLFYVPVAAHYLRLSLRYRHPLLPSAANPAVEGGGLINESKDPIYALLPPGPWRLRHRLFRPGAPAGSATAWMRRIGLSFPVIAKPDRGQRGSGVRWLRGLADLRAYAATARSAWLLQEHCAWPHEAGVFYVRRPGQARGFLYSITAKRFPVVEGDGRRCLADLILDHPRYRLQADVFFKRHRAKLDTVLAAGERLALAQAGNHCQGTLFLDGRDLGGEGLRRALDRLADRMPGFHIGRFDLRYRDPDAFRQGCDFKIIELNLGGAEAGHIYDPAIPLAEAYRVLAGQWDLFFERGDYERRRGAKVLGLGQFWAEARAYRRAALSHGGTD